LALELYDEEKLNEERRGMIIIADRIQELNRIKEDEKLIAKENREQRIVEIENESFPETVKKK
jgi:hypothetical protein